jgi:hypothetical protein
MNIPRAERLMFRIRVELAIAYGWKPHIKFLHQNEKVEDYMTNRNMFKYLNK